MQIKPLRTGHCRLYNCRVGGPYNCPNKHYRFGIRDNRYVMYEFTQTNKRTIIKYRVIPQNRRK